MHQKVFDLNILQGAVYDICKVGGEACSEQPKKWMLIRFRSAFKSHKQTRRGGDLCSGLCKGPLCMVGHMVSTLLFIWIDSSLANSSLNDKCRPVQSCQTSDRHVQLISGLHFSQPARVCCDGWPARLPSEKWAAQKFHLERILRHGSFRVNTSLKQGFKFFLTKFVYFMSNKATVQLRDAIQYREKQFDWLILA